MGTVNVHEAKTHLSKLLERVEAGEEVTIARAGKPIARLVPLAPQPRVAGDLAGRGRIAADFDAPMTDEELWSQGAIEPAAP
jgi:prevent-host-death family protein